MKPCTRFHYEDIEPGDRLRLLREDEKPVEIVVKWMTDSRNWGRIIHSKGPDDETYYLNDYDSVEYVP